MVPTVDTGSPKNPPKLTCTFSTLTFSIPISLNVVKKMMLIELLVSIGINQSSTFFMFKDITKASSCAHLRLKNVNECSYSGSDASYSSASELTHGYETTLLTLSIC